LCAEFDAVCSETIEATAWSERQLKRVSDSLWALSRRICQEVELVGEGDGERLERLRHDVFLPCVLKWYRRHPAIDRLWTKPAGYSGDWQTIETICTGIIPWRAFEDIFLHHLLRCEMAEQHRQKVREQAAFIVRRAQASTGHRARILDGGCEPCCDVRLALEQLAGEFSGELVLLDADSMAIEFSRRKLAQFTSGAQLHFVAEDAFRFMRHASREGGLSFDGILFGGLFDYLSDRQIAFLLRRARKLLSPSGKILFSQVSKANSDRTFMKWFGDWELIERNEQDIRAILHEIGISTNDTRMWREATGMTVMVEVAGYPCRP